jgi:molybdenum cofactor cytidylyltransferase
MPISNERVTAVVLAAGYSSRMGCNKYLLPIDGEAMIVHILKKISAVCKRIIVVLGHDEKILRAVISSAAIGTDQQIEFVVNADFQLGMFSSLQRGLRETENTEWVLYHFGDQPSLPPEFYTEFIEQTGAGKVWIQPKYKDRNGHPILINKKLFSVITSAPVESSLRECLSRISYERYFWRCEYPGVLQDIDTREEFEKLMR